MCIMNLCFSTCQTCGCGLMRMFLCHKNLKVLKMLWINSKYLVDKLYFCTMQFRKNSKYSNKALRRLMSALAILGILYSCASIGRLEGGPIDEDPPRFVASTPLPGELNSKRSKVTIEFDEFIKLYRNLSVIIALY